MTPTPPPLPQLTDLERRVAEGGWLIELLLPCTDAGVAFHRRRRTAVQARMDACHPDAHHETHGDAPQAWGQVRTPVEAAVGDQGRRAGSCIGATVGADVERVHASAAVSDRVTVSGHVHDLATGTVSTVEPARRRGEPFAPAG